MKATVVTIAAGRRPHLARQCEALERFAPESEHVVVDMGSQLADWRIGDPRRPTVIPMPSASSPLPLAAARNLGARSALEAGAEALVFLDVDCVPSVDCLGWYGEALNRRPDALLTGAVGYLPPGASSITATDSDSLDDLARFHDFRPQPALGQTVEAGHHLFWSLSFAATASTWEQIGGFDESYLGYGAEDTDFGERARVAGVPLLFVGGATAFHQHHDVESPPVRHLDDILRNGAVFAERWGYWPMRGWLEAFENDGLVSRDPDTGAYRRAVAA
ncbi:glycosyltransferase family 2 protein [Amnibacterium flavum]|uniref:Sugar transferase n=1 Tax=Amnibacterium flavum TaxID=2173173 RepID=A0A2V1HW37_9MICO|nr:galactosyltransferase-related protein [Amnibacterium flavum]PVZ95349.1 sugar transferase [Amnibacterium flavum]